MGLLLQVVPQTALARGHFGAVYRRKAFWVAKQVLQLGMGDAFDDWLIEKIQLLRRGSVVASGINRLEQVILFLIFDQVCFFAGTHLTSLLACEQD